MAKVILKPTANTSLTVNSKLFLAVVLSLGAWHLYPETRAGWGWGFIAILMWLSAFGCVVHAIKRMFKQKFRDDAWLEKVGKGPEMSGTDLPSNKDLKDRGVIYED